jgi:hypothetical protein
MLAVKLCEAITVVGFGVEILINTLLAAATGMLIVELKAGLEQLSALSTMFPAGAIVEGARYVIDAGAATQVVPVLIDPFEELVGGTLTTPQRTVSCPAGTPLTVTLKARVA